MKAGILYDDRDIRVGDAPEPHIGPDDVLVETSHTGICGTDLHIYRGEFRERVSYPAIIGHEFGGTIREVGKDVQGLRAGDPVVVDPIISCHACPACLSGHLNVCRSLKLLGIELGGGFGQYVAAPSNRVYRLPYDFPMAQAPMVEMYSLGCRILLRGQVQPDAFGNARQRRRNAQHGWPSVAGGPGRRRTGSRCGPCEKRQTQV